MDVLKKAARVSQIIMGLALLVSGLVKVWEPVLFYWEVVPYTQLMYLTKIWSHVAQAALLMGPFECAVGIALLANWRPRLTYPVSVVLMVFFIGLMVAAWKVGATDDCGCFGALVERSPGEAAVEDVVMLALLLFGWWGTRSRGTWPKAGWLVGGGAVLGLVVGAVQFVPEMERLEKSDLLPGVRLTGLNPKGLETDIMEGDYLIELMSPKCGRCIESIPKLNRLADEADLPAVIALNNFPQESEELKQFKARLQPRFPVATISKTDFFRLTVKHGYPRLALVRDGVVQKVWEYYEFPTLDKIRKAVAGS